MFFGHRAIAEGLGVLIFTTMAVIVTFIYFFRIDGKAAAFLLPLVLWLTLATHLNLYIYLHNA